MAVNSDEQARRLKGEGRPLLPQNERAELVSSLRCVDLVTIFPQTRATYFISASEPAIYVKGGDYTTEMLNAEERAALKKIGAEIRILSFEKGYSTSLLLERLQGIGK